MRYQLLFISILLLGCTAHQNNQTSINSCSDEVKYSLADGEFEVKLITLSSNDTLNTYNDGSEMDKLYSSPIILDQYLFFYYHSELIKIVTPPIPYIKKHTIHNDSVNVLKTPIYEICLIKSNQNELFYYISGADYCFGQCCLEFSGLYSSRGEIIFQKFNNEHFNESLDEVFIRKGLKFKNWEKCIKTAK